MYGSQDAAAASRHVPYDAGQGYPPQDDPHHGLGTPPMGMGQPRPVRQGSSSAQSSAHSSFDEAQGVYPYNHSGSLPSLPRYSSGYSANSSSNHLPHPSPLNPSAGPRPTRDGPPSRFSSYGYSNGGHQGGNGNGAHPLSNAMYMDSSPTLAGSEMASPSEEKMRLANGDDPRGNYTVPTLTRDTSPGGPNGQPFRRPPKASGFAGIYRAWSGANLADSGKDERHVKLPRLGYLDGCKFIAAWIVLNGTLFDAVLEGNDYSFIQRNSPLYITRSTGLGITFLLLLSGRSLITPLWDVPAASAAGIGGTGGKPNSALISWARLTRAMLVRPFRFLLPVIAIAALQWGLGSTGKTSNCNNVGMDEPYWGLISNFAGFSTLIFDLFTWYEQDTLAGQTFAANLWVSPWFFQSSYAVYVTHMMLGNLSSNRYWVYGLLCFFSWTTYNYFYVAFLGLIIADMHAHGHLHRIRTKWGFLPRLSLHLALIVLACVTQFVPVIRDNLNKGMATINVQDHPELTFADSIFAFAWIFCIETSGLAQNIMGNIVMRSLGKLSPGLFLIAPAITFTIVPDLALSLHNNGSSAASVLGVSWLVLFACTFAFSIFFHFLVELPSKMVGEVVSEILEGPSRGHVTRKSTDGGVKLVKSRNAAGPTSGAGPRVQQKAKPVLV